MLLSRPICGLPDPQCTVFAPRGLLVFCFRFYVAWALGGVAFRWLSGCFRPPKRRNDGGAASGHAWALTTSGAPVELRGALFPQPQSPPPPQELKPERGMLADPRRTKVIGGCVGVPVGGCGRGRVDVGADNCSGVGVPVCPRREDGPGVSVGAGAVSVACRLAVAAAATSVRVRVAAAWSVSLMAVAAAAASVSLWARAW